MSLLSMEIDKCSIFRRLFLLPIANTSVLSPFNLSLFLYVQVFTSSIQCSHLSTDSLRFFVAFAL